MSTFLKMLLLSQALLLGACSLDVSIHGEADKFISLPSEANSNEVKGVFPLGVAPFWRLHDLVTAFAYKPDGSLLLNNISVGHLEPCPITINDSAGAFKGCLAPTNQAMAVRNLAVDSSGNTYVTLAYSDNSASPPIDIHKVVKYDSDGNLLYTLGNTQSSADGMFFSANAVIFDTDGTFLVADSGNCRVQRFSQANGSFISKFGTCGTGNGQIDNSIVSIDIDGSRNIYLRESNGRIQKYTSAGTWISSFSHFSYPTAAQDYGFAGDMAVDSSGNIYVLDISAGKLLKYDNSGAFQWSYDGSATDTALNFPDKVKFGPGGNLYISNQHSIAVVKPDGSFVRNLKAGTPTISAPVSIALDKDGKVYAGQATGDIAKVDSYGNSLLTIATHGEIALYLVLDKSGNMYSVTTADLQNFSLHKYLADGTEVANFASGIITGNPTALAIDASDVLYVVDKGASSSVIKTISTSGVQLSTLGSGHLTAPSAISVAPDGSSITVFDSGLIRLDATGALHAHQYVTSGTGSLGATSYGMYQDASGNLFVSDSAGTNEVVKFNASGSAVGRYGQTGMLYGLVLTMPFGITGDTEGNIYVADAGAQNIQKFSPTGQQLFK